MGRGNHLRCLRGDLRWSSILQDISEQELLLFLISQNWYNELILRNECWILHRICFPIFKQIIFNCIVNVLQVSSWLDVVNVNWGLVWPADYITLETMPHRTNLKGTLQQKTLLTSGFLTDEYVLSEQLRSFDHAFSHSYTIQGPEKGHTGRNRTRSDPLVLLFFIEVFSKAMFHDTMIKHWYNYWLGG